MWVTRTIVLHGSPRCQEGVFETRYNSDFFAPFAVNSSDSESLVAALPRQALCGEISESESSTYFVTFVLSVVNSDPNYFSRSVSPLDQIARNSSTATCTSGWIVKRAPPTMPIVCIGT